MFAKLGVVIGLGLILGALSSGPILGRLMPSASESATAKRASTVYPLRVLELEASLPTQEQLDGYAPLPEVFERQFQPTRVGVDLGRQFFFDARFSRNQDVSCNSCHPLHSYGMDGRGVSIGHLGQTGTRNAPSVYNAAGHGIQFWDGRAADVEQQASMPVFDPFEMAMTEERLLQTLRSIPEYVAELKRLFPEQADPVTVQNFQTVIGSFERGLVTKGRWDRYLEGEKEALTQAEQRGFSTFYQLGCVSCHTGSPVGGTHFEVLGQSRPWPNQTDRGSSRAGDAPVFKVASLRNVEKTAPYFHDASSDTLDDAVRRMAAHQLGLELTDTQLSDVVAWLKALTGALPEYYIQPPELPPSTEETPKPDNYGFEQVRR